MEILLATGTYDEGEQLATRGDSYLFLQVLLVPELYHETDVLPFLDSGDFLLDRFVIGWFL